MNIIFRWHTLLGMPIHDEVWHRNDIADELAEYRDARGMINKWSELSDVVYTFSRARWSGYVRVEFPFSRRAYVLGLLYMFPKYTLRWRFFRTLGHRFDPGLHLTEVRNPQKMEKLEAIARKYSIDPVAFTNEAQQLMRRRIFLK